MNFAQLIAANPASPVVASLPPPESRLHLHSRSAAVAPAEKSNSSRSALRLKRLMRVGIVVVISQNLLHRIVTTGGKRLTPQQTPDRHARSAHRAMAVNCFERVFGTSRSKSAGRRQPRRDYCFIKLQKRNQNKPHCLVSSIDFSLCNFGTTQAKVYATAAQPAPPAQRSYETPQTEVLQSKSATGAWR